MKQKICIYILKFWAKDQNCMKYFLFCYYATDLNGKYTFKLTQSLMI